MPEARTRNSESTFNLRIDSALKAEFAAAVEAEDRPAAEVIRELMRTTWRKRGSAALPPRRAGSRN